MSIRANIAAAAVLFASAAWPHDHAHGCEAAASKEPALEAARAEVKQKPRASNLRAGLADRLIAIGCYDEAVIVLEEGLKFEPGDRGLQTRLRTARSFIGEREFLKQQPAPAAVVSEAVLVRLQVRCKTVADLQACEQALANKPNDAALWAAKGDALLKEKRAQEALAAFNRARQVSATFPQDAPDLTARFNAAQAMLATQKPPSIAPSKAPVRTAVVTPATQPPPNAAVRVASAPAPVTKRYSNIEPPSRSN